MTIAAIRTALATAATGITGLKGIPYEADNVNPVVAQVGLRAWRYDDVMVHIGDTVYTFAVTVIAGRIAENRNQQTLDTYIDQDAATALKTALEAAATVTSAGAQYITVTGGSTGPLTVGAVDYLAAEFEVNVIV